MTVKEMKCVYAAISNAQYAIEQLACENYPYTEFEDEDVREMFYTLNSFCISIRKKIDVSEAAANN